MAYRYFTDFKEARKEGFMTSNNLADKSMTAAPAFAGLSSVQQDRARQRLYALFAQAAYALQQEMLNAPSDVKSVTLAGVAVPVSAWAFIKTSNSGRNKNPLFTIDALDPVGALAANLGRWRGTGEKSLDLAHSPHWDRLRKYAVQAFLRGEKLLTGENPGEIFFMNSNGQLSTNLSVHAVHEMNERIEHLQDMEFRLFRGVATKNFDLAHAPIQEVFHARKQEDKELQRVYGIKLPANSIRYVHSRQGRYSLCYAPEIAEQIRLIHNAVLRGIASRRQQAMQPEQPNIAAASHRPLTPG